MRTIAIAPIVLALILTSAAVGEGTKPARTISVTGTAVTRTPPDVIVWRLSLEDLDKDLSAAKTRNDQKVKSVLALRDPLGIETGDLETGRLSIRREYERDQHHNRGPFKHFVVTRSITIRQRDLARFDEFLDKFVTSGDMEVDFSFESTEIHEVRAETRLKALKAAHEKATAMAGVVGAELGRILTIEEHRPTTPWTGYASNAAFSTGPMPDVDVPASTFVPGAVEVRITVYATFELE